MGTNSNGVNLGKASQCSCAQYKILLEHINTWKHDVFL